MKSKRKHLSHHDWEMDTKAKINAPDYSWRRNNLRLWRCTKCKYEVITGMPQTNLRKSVHIDGVQHLLDCKDIQRELMIYEIMTR